ncbi:MAG: flagellar type III secretion system pore protein FliP [Alphaproteobacteria bacterium]|nr:flagellar type III secretion system pore protein FliP [Alphaproteobacteria bacterium]
MIRFPLPTWGQKLGLAVLSIGLASPAWAQSLNINMAEGISVTSQLIHLIALVTVLSLAPSIIVMVTSFTRIVVVLALLRTALGLQQTPPNAVLISLALFATGFIMAPTLEQIYQEGLAPLLEESIDEAEAFERAAMPIRRFMLDHVRGKDLELFLELATPGGDEPPVLETPDDTPLRSLIPAFMISELRRAFEIGFLIFIPFLVIDMVVASVLMSMGMMMLPPVLISMPFKLVFFVLVDGWYLIMGSLVASYGGEGAF